MLLAGVRLEACEVVEEAQCLGLESSGCGGDHRHDAGKTEPIKCACSFAIESHVRNSGTSPLRSPNRPETFPGAILRPVSDEQKSDLVIPHLRFLITIA